MNKFKEFILSPDGTRVLVLVLWLLSLMLMAEYAMNQTVKLYDLTTIRMVGTAESSCQEAEASYDKMAAQYKALTEKAEEYAQSKGKVGM